jgi:hypothetical protein
MLEKRLRTKDSKWTIEVKTDKSVNEDEAFKLFFNNLKNSSHVKNNFRDFMNATNKDSQYSELVRIFKQENN